MQGMGYAFLPGAISAYGGEGPCHASLRTPIGPAPRMGSFSEEKDEPSLLSGPAPRTGKFSDAWVTSYLCFGPAPPVWGVLKTAWSGSGRRRIAPLMWGYVRLPEPAHCGHWALPACVGKLGLSPTEPPLHGGSPRPYGEVSYSGTSSEFSRGSTSLVWGSSGKMSPTPSASGGLPAHVGRFLNGCPSTPDALAVPFVWGCFAVGAVEPPSRGLSRPRRGRMGETGIVSPPGGIRRVRHRRCRGVRETPFSERSACRIYCRRRRGGMRWARHLPY